MHILITNITLASRTGTEIFIRDFARGLVGRGCRVSVYSPELGPIAEELRAAGITASDRWADFDRPDVIHGHHNLTTLSALARFPTVPALFVCHDVWAWHDFAFTHPRVLRYVGISRGTHAHLLRHGADPARSSILYNFTPVERFPPRGPLPQQPRRALVFSNYGTPAAGYGAVVAEACREAGLQLDFAGDASGNPVAEPERILGNYDIVFAKGKAAIEAIITGCATILCDTSGLGPMVKLENSQQIRHGNCGVDFLKESHTIAGVRERLAAYDAASVSSASDWLRREASLELALDRWQQLYGQLLAEPCPADAEADRIASAEAISRIAVAMRNQQIEVMQDRRPDPAFLERLASTERALAAIEATLSWKLRNRLIRLPGVEALGRMLRPKAE